MKKKMSISTIKVKSFMTELDNDLQIKGGGGCPPSALHICGSVTCNNGDTTPGRTGCQML